MLQLIELDPETELVQVAALLSSTVLGLNATPLDSQEVGITTDMKCSCWGVHSNS